MSLANEPTLLFDGVVRFDSATQTKEKYDFGAGRFGAESPCAPRDGSTGEADGYLVSFVNDLADDRAEIIVLAADDIAAGPVARIRLPMRVPAGFHATWVRED